MLLIICRRAGVLVRNTLRPSVLGLTECHSILSPILIALLRFSTWRSGHHVLGCPQHNPLDPTEQCIANTLLGRSSPICLVFFIKMSCEFGPPPVRSIHKILNDLIERLLFAGCIPNCFRGVSVCVPSNEISFQLISLHKSEATEDCKSIAETLLLHRFGRQRTLCCEPVVGFDDLDGRSTTGEDFGSRAFAMNGENDLALVLRGPSVVAWLKKPSSS